ncbi:hypothetical protein U1Q18_032580 [Sarracenia purpurea var. burkii]
MFFLSNTDSPSHSPCWHLWPWRYRIFLPPHRQCYARLSLHFLQTLTTNHRPSSSTCRSGDDDDLSFLTNLPRLEFLWLKGANLIDSITIQEPEPSNPRARQTYEHPTNASGKDDAGKRKADDQSWNEVSDEQDGTKKRQRLEAAHEGTYVYCDPAAADPQPRRSP